MDEFWKDFSDSLCGFDEAGRGPLAGPVTAGAVILGPGFPRDLVTDSKKMTEKSRENALPVIMSQSKAWGLGWVWPEEIDRLNILQASLLAMARAWDDLVRNFPEYRIPDTCPLGIADGLYCPQVPIICRPLVKGDALVPAVGAASILAKVARDRWMERWSWIDDRYGFEVHKGYPTEAHKRALGVHGPSVIHRLSFKWKDSQNFLDFGP